jgi:peptidoglycan-associated lipoprotein
MHTRSKEKVLLFAALAVILSVAGCAKKPPVAQAPPTPPPPAPVAPPRPTVTLKASSTLVQQGDSVTLSWSSTNATELDLSPGVGRVAPEGSTKVTPATSTNYTITASGPGGNTSDSVRITVAAAAPPVQPKPESSMEELFASNVKDAYFDYDKADIRSDARDALARTAEFLRNYAQVRVVIEGHCDERGSTEYNLALGDRRAQAVRQFLISLGISADRMEIVSLGKEKPFCTQSNEECWQQNSRGHFVLGAH